tara:strand:- start:1733 stop:1861 length:129 start_codon:yes stop_codon:yes gene_type:complete
MNKYNIDYKTAFNDKESHEAIREQVKELLIKLKIKRYGENRV